MNHHDRTDRIDPQLVLHQQDLPWHASPYHHISSFHHKCRSHCSIVSFHIDHIRIHDGICSLDNICSHDPQYHTPGIFLQHTMLHSDRSTGHDNPCRRIRSFHPHHNDRHMCRGVRPRSFHTNYLFHIRTHHHRHSDQRIHPLCHICHDTHSHHRSPSRQM